MLRIVLAFLFVALIYPQGIGFKIAASIVFIIAALTDYWDGYYAKKLNIITNFGKIMDPIADKVLILSAFFVFAQIEIIDLWMVVLIALREIYITVWRLINIRNKVFVAAEKLGKLKTVMQISAIIIILGFLIYIEAGLARSFSYYVIALWQLIIFLLMVIVVLITIISGMTVLINNRRVIK